MDDMQPLTDKLATRLATKMIELQGTRSDAAMAAILGCTREHYWNVTHGKRQLSYARLKRANRIFPELGLILIRDLTEPVAEEVAS